MDTPLYIMRYTYGDGGGWGDLLTAYNGVAITYDEIGNTLTDGTWTYTWERGRQLKSMAKSGTTWNMTYDADGLRTSRIATDSEGNTGNKYYYYYEGGLLTYMKFNTLVMRFTYDAQGNPVSMTYNGNIYFYVLNLQGDVMALLDANGNEVVSYHYNAWGEIISTTASTTGMLNTLAKYNPLRYRGYVYDREIGLYYVSSRYYNPEICRFINADNVDLLGINGGVVSYNLFAYCGNNPVSRKDPSGHAFETIWDIVSLASSIAEVVANPTNPWAWAGLVGDIIDVALPGIGGLGEAVDAVSTSVRVVDKCDDVIDAAKTLHKTADAADDLKNSVGAYVVLYEGGQHYIGKGGFQRAITSAKNHMSTQNKVSAIVWAPTSSNNSAFVTEYLLQSTLTSVRGNNSTFNKIWSPGRRILKGLQ